MRNEAIEFVDAKAQGFIDHFGDESQIMAAIEEMAELTTLLAKYLNGKLDDSGATLIQQEVADATIMLRQLRRVFGAKEVDEIIDMKIARLEQRIASGAYKPHRGQTPPETI